jgi:hypothetical protein
MRCFSICDRQCFTPDHEEGAVIPLIAAHKAKHGWKALNSINGVVTSQAHEGALEIMFGSAR